jgi:hypothetical protein
MIDWNAAPGNKYAGQAHPADTCSPISQSYPK